jgi:hypothetical protein
MGGVQPWMAADAVRARPQNVLDMLEAIGLAEAAVWVRRGGLQAADVVTETVL